MKTKICLVIIVLAIVMVPALYGEVYIKNQPVQAFKQSIEAAESDSHGTQEVPIFKDFGMKELIWKQLNIGENESNASILKKLGDCEKIEIKGYRWMSQIYSIEDLKFLTGLKELIIDVPDWEEEIHINDFSPILQLENLESLSYFYKEKNFNELSRLKELPKLKEVSLDSCNITDVTFLEELSNLEKLILSNNHITDISSISKLPKLKELTLSNNPQLRIIKAISNLTSLEVLEMDNCGIEDISFISRLISLKEINARENYIKDLGSLSELVQLESLLVGGNQVLDISVLTKLKGLFNLDISSNEVKDITVLSNCKELRYLDISNNAIEDIGIISGLNQMISLYVDGNPVKSLEPAFHIPQIYFWGCGYTKEKEKLADSLVKKYLPDIGRYCCDDYSMGDINGDSIEDMAVVVGLFEPPPKDYESDFDFTDKETSDGREIPPERKLYIFLQNKDGSYMVQEPPISVSGPFSGGVKGEAYWGAYNGIYMGEGFLLLKDSGGSSDGWKNTGIYSYNNGEWITNKTIELSTNNFVLGAQVTFYNLENDNYESFACASDGNKMTKLLLDNTKHPYLQGYADTSLSPWGFVVKDKINTNYTPQEALDAIKNKYFPGGSRQSLSYPPEIRASLEKLNGVELPDYYYVMKKADKGSGEEDFILSYNHFGTLDDGQPAHEIMYYYHTKNMEYSSGREYHYNSYYFNDANGSITIP